MSYVRIGKNEKSEYFFVYFLKKWYLCILKKVPSYYVYINNQQQGPFTSAQIGNMIASRTIDMNAQVWKQGMAEWMPINKVADLKKLFK